MANSTRRVGTGRDILGSLIGLLVFLGGVGLLVLVFRLAYDMFTVPPEAALGIKANQPIRLENAATTLVGIGLRIITLVLMAVVGSVVANRGINLYAHCRPHRVAVSTEEPA